MIENEKYRNKSLEYVGEKKSPFWKGSSHSHNMPHDRGCYYYAMKASNQEQHKKYDRFQSPFQNISARKFQYGSSTTQGKLLFRISEGGFFHQNLKTGTTGINGFDTSSTKKNNLPKRYQMQHLKEGYLNL